MLSSGLSPSGDVAMRLREYRRLRGFTQQHLAEVAGVKRQTISNIERGASPGPNMRTLERLAHALDADVASLLNRRALSPPEIEVVQTTSASVDVLSVSQEANGTLQVTWKHPFPLTANERAALASLLAAQFTLLRAVRYEARMAQTREARGAEASDE